MKFKDVPSSNSSRVHFLHVESPFEEKVVDEKLKADLDSKDHPLLISQQQLYSILLEGWVSNKIENAGERLENVDVGHLILNGLVWKPNRQKEIQETLGCETQRSNHVL